MRLFSKGRPGPADIHEVKLREGARVDDLHGWVLAEGALDADCPALHVARVFSEAAIVEWEPVPAATVEYRVEWAAKDEPEDSSRGPYLGVASQNVHVWGAAQRLARWSS